MEPGVDKIMVRIAEALEHDIVPNDFKGDLCRKCIDDTLSTIGVRAAVEYVVAHTTPPIVDCEALAIRRQLETGEPTDGT